MRLTIRDIQRMKDAGERIPMLTTYDYTTAQMVDAAECAVDPGRRLAWHGRPGLFIDRAGDAGRYPAPCESGRTRRVTRPGRRRSAISDLHNARAGNPVRRTSDAGSRLPGCKT